MDLTDEATHEPPRAYSWRALDALPLVIGTTNEEQAFTDVVTGKRTCHWASKGVSVRPVRIPTTFNAKHYRDAPLYQL